MIKSKGRYHRTIWTPEELEFVKTYSRHWHEREHQVLVQYYPVGSMAVADRLPGRTRASMRQAAYSMGLKFPARLPHIRGTSSVGGLFFALNPRRLPDDDAIYKRLVRLPRAQRHQANY